jgi:hypothetical protein
VQGLVAGEDGGKSNKRRWRSAEKRGPKRGYEMEYGVTMGAWVFTSASLHRETVLEIFGERGLWRAVRRW